MSHQDWKSLRVQCLLVAGLFAICAVGSIAIGLSRGWVEGLLKETYADPKTATPRMEALMAVASTGTEKPIVPSSYALAEQMLLYEYWMHPESKLPDLTVHAMVHANPEEFLLRAERTLIRGNEAQRLKAILFLELAGAIEFNKTVDILSHVKIWFLRKYPGDSQLITRIDAALAGIQKSSDSR